MELFKEDKFSKWKHILKKLHNAKIVDPQRLDTIQTQLEKGQSPFSSDINYLEEKYKEFEQYLTTHPNIIPQEDVKKPNFEREMQMIEQLHQKEIGNFSRLESIRNYLMVGQPLLHEDSVYLSEQYEQLKKVLELNVFNSETKSTTRTSQIQPQAILIDDVEEYPTHEFDSLSRTIANIIRNSIPHFTIGIYGEWGTGKTTLMKSIEKNLTNENPQGKEQTFLPIWFNAWKYEREENLASVSLMKTVGYAMANHSIFDQLSKTIFKGLTIVGKDVMQQIAMQAVSKKRELADEEIEEKMDYLNTLYRDSVYYEGLEKIHQQMESVRSELGDHRVVIFIDDLDRCSPIKALEVLESIKLFLDIGEFVNNKDFREIIKWMLTKPKDLRKYFKYLRIFIEEFPAEQRMKRILYLNKLTERTNGKIDSNLIDILADFDNDTWLFLTNVKDVMYGIQNWKVIDNVMDVVEEFTYDLPIGSKKSKSTQEHQALPQNQAAQTQTAD